MTHLLRMNPSIAEAARAVAAPGTRRAPSGAIVLGCAGMARLTPALQQRLGAPVIDGVAVAVTFAEALAAPELQTSKRGDCATPLRERYEGWAAALGWPDGG